MDPPLWPIAYSASCTGKQFGRFYNNRGVIKIKKKRMAESKWFSHNFNYREKKITTNLNTRARQKPTQRTAAPLTHHSALSSLLRVTRSAYTSSGGLPENTSPTRSTLIFSIRIQVHPGAVPRLELGDEFLL